MESTNYHREQDVNLAISEQLIRYLKYLKDSNVNKNHIVISHVMIDGARAENNQPMIGEGVNLGAYDLEEAGFLGGIYGHIHLKQTFANSNFYYNGSPTALDFGESSDDKYFSVFDTQSKTVEWYELSGINRFSINGEWINGQWFHPSDIDPLCCSGARVRVTYRIEATDDMELARSTVKEFYSKYKPIELKINPIVETQTRTRAESVSAANTLLDKLIAYWEATETTPEEKERKAIIDKLKIAEEQCSTNGLL
jgi:DNA repair exonuclease SbcCD nuclease subunit